MKKALSLIVLLLSVVMLAPAAHAEEEKMSFNEHEYQIVYGSYSWEEAEALCEEAGGHLVTVATEQEQSFIDSLLNVSGYCLWIGAYRDAGSDWHWITGEAWDHTAWAEGEPYDSQEYGYAATACEEWFSLECTSEETYGYICEWDHVTSDCTEHIPVTDPAVEPTCSEYGLTEGSHCSICGEVLVAQKTVAKKDHTYITKTVKATPSKNGCVAEKCSACGHVKSKKTTYKISSIKLSSATVTYNGKVRTPSVVVKDSKGNALKKGTDFTVKYASGRKAVGAYKITVTFKGKYSGSKALSLRIDPKGTKISTLTAKPQGFEAKWSKQTTQTTGYQLQYAANSRFSSPKTVTVGGNTTVSKSVTKLKASTKYYVRVRTYKTVKDVKYYSAWSQVKTVTTQKAISIKLNAGTLTLYAGDGKTLKATTFPAKQTVSWKTSDKTVVTVTGGEAKVRCKGKTRKVFIVADLKMLLLDYIRKNNIKSGSIFLSKTGKPMNRTTVWREMKSLCKKAKVNPSKVFRIISGICSQGYSIKWKRISPSWRISSVIRRSTPRVFIWSPPAKSTAARWNDWVLSSR